MKKSEAKAPSSSQSLSNAYIIENDTKGKEWELWAKKGIFNKEKNDWHIDEIRSIFYGEDKVNYHLTGNTGSLISDQSGGLRTLEITGKIKMNSTSDLVFETDKALYRKESRKLMFPNPIEVQGPKESDRTRLKITGQKMSLDLATNEMIIEGQVVGTKQVPKKGKAILKADKASLTRNRTRFMGNVSIVNDLIKITGTEAEFIYKNNKIKTAIILNVTANEPGREVRAGRLLIDMEKMSYVFTESPVAIMDNSELRGETITILNQGQQILVSNGVGKISPDRPIKPKN